VDGEHQSVRTPNMAAATKPDAPLSHLSIEVFGGQILTQALSIPVPLSTTLFSDVQSSALRSSALTWLLANSR
jgi:hypothetical protein